MYSVLLIIFLFVCLFVCFVFCVFKFDCIVCVLTVCFNFCCSLVINRLYNIINLLFDSLTTHYVLIIEKTFVCDNFRGCVWGRMSFRAEINYPARLAQNWQVLYAGSRV